MLSRMVKPGRKVEASRTPPIMAQQPSPPPPAPLDPSGSAVVPPEAMKSTVKIYNFSVSSNYMRPWTKMEGESCTGSGYAIEGRYILTNYHVVRDHQLLQVQQHDRPGKWIARALVEGVQCDLALLTVDDAKFWDELPLQQCVEVIPSLQQVVTAVGYPVGGENLSVTRGVVSRIDLLDYTFLEQVAYPSQQSAPSQQPVLPYHEPDHPVPRICHPSPHSPRPHPRLALTLASPSPSPRPHPPVWVGYGRETARATDRRGDQPGKLGRAVAPPMPSSPRPGPTRTLEPDSTPGRCSTRRDALSASRSQDSTRRTISGTPPLPLPLPPPSP